MAARSAILQGDFHPLPPVADYIADYWTKPSPQDIAEHDVHCGHPLPSTRCRCYPLSHFRDAAGQMEELD